MALKTSGGLETVSLVLTADQLKQLRLIRDIRKSEVNRISLSDIAREVVAEGLRSFTLVAHSDFEASRIIDTKAA